MTAVGVHVLPSDGRPRRASRLVARPAPRLRRLRAASTPRPACFVALEGGEGAGKSTQARLLRDWLRDRRVRRGAHPRAGGHRGRSRAARIVLDPATGTMSHRTEALLYAADKAEHVDRVVAPALDRGAVVVTDRYVDSTLAYQGAGRDLGRRARSSAIARWATDDLRPHLTVLLDLEPPTAGADPLRGARPDRGGVAWTSTSACAQMFLRLAAASPERYLVVDARAAVERDRRRGSVRASTPAARRSAVATGRHPDAAPTGEATRRASPEERP